MSDETNCSSGSLLYRGLTLGAVVAVGTGVGCLLNAFAHLRHLYSDDPKKKEKELARLAEENCDKLKGRMMIGAILGGLAGLYAGYLLSSCCRKENCSEEE